MPRFGLLCGLVALATAAACSGSDDIDSDSSEVVGHRTWTLSPDAEAAGRVVRLAYDAAPIWSGTSSCAGKLRDGTRDVGAFLSDRFAAIDTVGGYACRRNTADTKRMSVHGTGRALDLMISTVNGAADSTHGDPVANYLVQNAQRIGIQLIIWNHTVWRANGTNTARYTGPIPHIDHIHVELTNEAAKRATAWFESRTTDADASTEDASADGETADAAPSDDDAGDLVEPDDASVPPVGDVDAGASEPVPAPPAETDAATSDAAPPAAPQEDVGDSYTLELPDDEPAKEDALGPRSRHATSSAEDDGSSTSSHGCSSAPGGSSNGALGLALFAAAVISRARRRR